jgi:hypothetical protein
MMKKSVRVAGLAAMFAALGAFAAVWNRGGPSIPRNEMAAAATRLVESFSDAERGKVRLAFDDKAREDWHFVPRTRPGARLADMNDAQKKAARNLLRSALSSKGVLKVELIMSLDAVLRELENNPGRDPLQYTFTVYGDPGAGGGGAWGWKIEGHHISLNFTCVNGQVSATTPAFLGANPAEVKSGPLAGQRAMAVEEDLGRRLLESCDAAQRKEMVIADKAPADILTVPGKELDAAAPAGLSYEKMNTAQRGMLEELLDEYAYNLGRELAHVELDRIRSAGLERIRFAWAGGSKPGEGHYYRITGPTFVIEYDNTQNNANHIHTIWHDREKDFGKDALREHLKHDHSHGK